MNRMTRYTTFASIGLLGCTMIALAQNAPGSPSSNAPPKPRQPAPPDAQPAPKIPTATAQAGYMETPRFAQKLETALAANAIQLYTDEDFKGTDSTFDNVLKLNQAGTLNEYPAKFDNAVSSLRWNLGPGVLVVLFDDASGKGQQLALWGKGQCPDLGKCDFNNLASRWSWYDVGGGAEPRSEGAMHMPYGSQALDATIPDSAVQLFDDQNFQNNQAMVAAIFGKKAGEWNMFPDKMENSVSSMRWNLPEGVVLIISAKDDGNKDTIIFGQAQNPDLSKIDFDNRASRWAWAYIGSPTKNAKPANP